MRFGRDAAVHERSLVKSLINQVLDETHARGLGRIHGIHLQIGEFSGVEPRLVESAFREMALEQWETEVTLLVEVVPLTACCQACRDSFSVTGYRFACPRCGSGRVDVTAGEELRLVSLTAERQTSDERVTT